MRRFILSVFILFGVAQMGFAQSALEAAELKLEKKLNALRASRDADEMRRLNKTFKEELEATFAIDGFFDYPFSRLTTMGSVKSPDNMLRLFNWNVEHEDQTHTYYCYIAHFHNNKLIVTELTDNSFMLPPRTEETLEYDNWYGALYYQIIPVKRKSKQMYTLVGWDGNSSFSDMKVLDVLYFSGSKPKLGYPIFKDEAGLHKRMFYEFKKHTVMTLRFEPSREMIIFDHLSPESPSLVGVYSYYVPDMSYDAFEWNGTIWEHKSDVIAVNPKDNRKRTVIRNRKGKIIKVVENEWVDPTQGDSPVDNGQHVAVPPDAQNGKPEKAKKPKKENKNDPYYPQGRKPKKNRPGSAIKIQK
jgi:hypothetical protein